MMPSPVTFDSVPAGEIVFSLARQFKELSSAKVVNKKQKYRNKGKPRRRTDQTGDR